MCGTDFRIEYLPYHVLLIILQNLQLKDILAVSMTCRKIYEMCASDAMWKAIVYRDFGVKTKGSFTTYYELYKMLLYPFGFIIGTYQRDLYAYGGLLEVKFHDSKIVGCILEGQANESALVEKKVFSISSNEKKGKKFLCYSKGSGHNCYVDASKEADFIVQTCSFPTKHELPKNEILIISKRMAFEEMFLTEALRVGLHYKRLNMSQFKKWPESARDKDGYAIPQLFEPGLFVGCYGSHGPELVMFYYKNEHQIIGLKITGDSNVFAGKVTIKVNLRYRMILSHSEQQDLEFLSKLQPVSSSEPLSKLEKQTFCLPTSVYANGSNIPKECTARYHGFGQIGLPDFREPSFIQLHAAVFNNDMIGAIFLELKHFILFRRVVNPFS